MSEMYKKFVPEENRLYLDFSEESLKQMYEYETNGKKFENLDNGYFQGKKWMDVTIEMWNEGLKSGLLCRYELEQEFPDWFLDKVLKFKGNRTSRIKNFERRQVVDHDSE